jgi:AraC-like DNA-binding protein
LSCSLKVSQALPLIARAGQSWHIAAVTEREFAKARGLMQLLELQRGGQHLFCGTHGDTASALIYPTFPTATLDPLRVRGFWVPGLGLLPPRLLVTYLFPNALVAAMLAVLQAPGGACALRIDDFVDGTVAVFFGENEASSGLFDELLRRMKSMADELPLEGYGVSVVRRDSVPLDRLSFPMPGAFVSERPVPVVSQVTLSVGDVRALASLLQFPLIPFQDAAQARCAPFSGTFQSGGHLRFDPLSGERLPIRLPTEADRRSAAARAELRGRRWLQRNMEKPLYTATPAPLPHRSAFGRALALIEQRCAEPLSISEIAEAAQLSVRHLHLLFHEILGSTPMRYLSERRLELAEQMIVGTSFSMCEIAQRCGFAEQASLTRSFKRVRGVTPMAVRKAARLQDATISAKR